MLELSQFNQFMLDYLDPEIKLVEDVGRHILSAGGKRLRPLLMMEVCRMLGGDVERVVPLAVGIEYIHMASLLHDDVVDGAHTRRGRPSANVLFGNQAVVLGGDYFYAKALWLYANYGNLQAVEMVSRAVMHMSQSQLLELLSLGKLISEEEYFRIIDGKTGALFGASMGVGALMAESPLAEEFYQMGLKVGRAFQLIDDALDYSSSEERLGKPVGNDLRDGKCTYPLLSVLDHLDKQWVLERFGKGNTEELRERVVLLGGVENTKKRAEEEIAPVLEFVGKFENSQALLQLIKGIVNRDH
ncbi:octoprenyl-diphosphate synthase [Thermocrinis ruber]|uniref:Octoprenyl-diphosphate synthase n=1 Tax=Thermocrinis ruber TaxID=75906 RepID=W0DH75_9AQUI|nr:polyprenyl synthetase family protein [Thermocrinis ruber]AHE96205.1 octoprenyl-diphosphate synthase [Thermocrinis ruber]